MQTAYFRFLLISIFGIFLSPIASTLRLQASSVCDYHEDKDWEFTEDGKPSAPTRTDLLSFFALSTDKDMSVETMANTETSSVPCYKITRVCDAETFEQFCETLPPIIDIDDSEIEENNIEKSFQELAKNIVSCRDNLKRATVYLQNEDSNAALTALEKADSSFVLCRLYQASLNKEPLTEAQQRNLKKSYEYTMSLHVTFLRSFPYSQRIL